MSLIQRFRRQIKENKEEVDRLITGKLLPDYSTYAFNIGKSRGLQMAMDILDNVINKEDNEPPREDD